MPFPGRSTPKDPWPEDQEENSAFRTDEDKLHDWRLLELIRAHTRFKEPIEMDDVKHLDRIADSMADLHTACRALERGCDPSRAADIFT